MTAARTHQCPKSGCSQQVDVSMLACKRHWFSLSAATRKRVWRAYKSGDQDAHGEAVFDAIEEMNR